MTETHAQAIKKLREVERAATMPLLAWADFHEALALLERAEPRGNGWDDVPEIAAMRKDEQAEPTQAEIDSYVSASDGDITKEQAKDALVKLRKTRVELKPEAGEFTKSLRSSIHVFEQIWIELPVDDPQINLTKQILSGANQACDRLDAQQQENERLKKENNRFREEDGCKDIVHCQTNAIIAKDKEIGRLTADLKAKDERIEKLTKYAAGIEDKEPYKDMVMEISAAMGNQANGSGISDKDLLAQIYKTLEEEKP